jgi:hypothetical protein
MKPLPRKIIRIKSISPAELARFKYINFLMNELHEDLNNIYEALADKEMDELNTHIKKLIQKLEDIYDDGDTIL